jgi:hypothetical protein
MPISSARADDVVEQALTYVFSKDRDFQDFLKTPEVKRVAPTLSIRKAPTQHTAEAQAKKPLPGWERFRSLGKIRGSIDSAWRNRNFVARSGLLLAVLPVAGGVKGLETWTIWRMRVYEVTTS